MCVLELLKILGIYFNKYFKSIVQMDLYVWCK